MMEQKWPPDFVTVFLHPRCDNRVAMQTIPISRTDIDRTKGDDFIPVGFVSYASYAAALAALKSVRKEAKKNRPDPDRIFQFADAAIAAVEAA